MASAPLRYRLLGPLDVVRPAAVNGAAAQPSDDPIELGSPKQRAVLAVLLLQRGRVVSSDRLIDAVWGDEAPPSALASLQAYISNLRRALRDGVSATSPIVRQAPGYVLDVPPDEVDLSDFVATADAARRAAGEGAWGSALELADRALALWRGPLLDDLRDEHWVQVEAAGAEELRAECRETRIAGLLADGRVSPALVEAQTLHAEHPLRERSAWLHLLSLYRAGRAPDALEEFRRYAERLDRDLGLDPGGELRDLQRAMLQQDPALAAWPRAPRWSGASSLQTPSADSTVDPHDGSDARTASPAGGSSLVGRRREVEIIDQLVDDVRTGHVRWLMLTGAAGIGKSRLAEECAARLRSAAGREVWARCPEEGGSPAWWPIRQIVAGLGGDPDEVLVPPEGVEADEARFAVYERVVRVIQGSADAGTALTIVVDDVQWADPTSVRCLAYVATALRQAPIAVVLTLRDGEAGDAVQPLLAGLARGEAYRQLAVPPLAADEVTELASRIAGEQIDGAEARLLAERTGGNPFFVGEYARLSREERLGDGIPLAVRSVLGRRLAGLDPGVLQVLRTAAVIGNQLDIEVLAASTGLDLDVLADALDEAADDHIIVTATGTGGYAFAHGLLREEILAAMPAPRRQRMHARVAEVLAGATDGEGLERRAQHLLAALPLVPATEVLEACRAAALAAAERWNSESAARWWEAALHAFDLLPSSQQESSERDDLQVARVIALARAGRGQTVLDVVERGLLDAVREGRTSAAGRLAGSLLRSSGAWPWASYGEDPKPVLERLAGLEPFVADDPSAHARVLAALAVGSCYDPDPSLADGLSRRALEIADALNDQDVTAAALLGRALTYSGISGRSPEVVELLGRLSQLSHRQAAVDEVIRDALLSLTWLNLGDLERVAEHTRRGTAGADLLRLPTIRAQMRWMGAVQAHWRGEFAQAEAQYVLASRMHRQTELYNEGIDDFARLSLAWDAGTLDDVEVSNPEPFAWEAAIAAARGEREAAVSLVERRLAHVTPPTWTTLAHDALIAHVVADLGLAQHADRLISRLAPHRDRIANIGMVGLIGTVSLALARLHRLQGRTAEAGALVERSLELCTRNGGIPTLLRSRLELAGLHPASPARTAELAAIADEARRLGMRRVGAAAEHLLET